MLKLLGKGASIADKSKAKAILSNACFKLLDREGVFQVAIMDAEKANQAILASLLQIYPGACMDFDDVACVNEKRNLDGCSRF